MKYEIVRHAGSDAAKFAAEIDAPPEPVAPSPVANSSSVRGVIDAKLAALVAINEALRCLEYSAVGPHAADALVDDAVDALATARDLLTDKPWPEFGLPTADLAAFESWHADRAEEQRNDGRL